MQLQLRGGQPLDEGVKPAVLSASHLWMLEDPTVCPEKSMLLCAGILLNYLLKD